MTPDEFRKIGYQLIDFIADYRAHVGERPVLSQAEPGAIKAAFPEAAPLTGEPLDTIIADVERAIMPGITHWAHPSFYGYFPSNGELSSVLGDLLSTGLGTLGLNWQASPALTELEEVMCDWLRRACGLSDAWSGVIQDTASTGTLVALICARERATNFSATRAGLQGEKVPLTLYVSAQAHSSVEKAALLAGFGRENVRMVAHDEQFALEVDELRRMIAADKAAGLRPCAIVATSGTTASTAFDPLAACAETAHDFGLWLHVDGAMGGAALLLPECRKLFDGIEGADSFIVNAHKWIGASFDCSLYYVRDPQHLVRVMSTTPSYLQTSADGLVKNYRDWGVPLGRRFRALKLWFLLREQGISGIQSRLRRDLENAQFLAGEVARAKNWRVVAPVLLQTVCVRHEPRGATGEALDRHTLSWADRLNRSGKAYVTPAKLDGAWMVRVSIASLPTERSHVEALWKLLRETAEAA